MFNTVLTVIIAMRSLSFSAVISILLLSCGIQGWAGERVSLATINWAPYAGEDLPNHGLTSEIVTEAFQRAGYRVDLTFMPLPRVLSRAARGDFHGMVPAYHSRERTLVFVLSEAIARSFLVFYKRREDNITFTGLRDLEGYRIGVVRGNVNPPGFDRAGYLQKERAASDESNLLKLLKGRIDLAVIDRYTARYILEKRIPHGAGRLEPLDPPLQVNPLYLGVSREVAGHQTIVEDFNRALSELASDGTLEKIKEKHGIVTP